MPSGRHLGFCCSPKIISQQKTVDDKDTAEMRSVLTYLCAADLRPFNVVEGAGFKKAAQFFISVGHKYGNVDINTILPSRATIADTCRSEAVEDRQKLVQTINAFVQQYGLIGVTTDMWQDSCKRNKKA